MDLAGLMATVAPQAGIGSVLVGLLVWVTRNASTDRGDYRTALAEAEERHRAELERVRTAYVAELAEIRERSDELAAQLEDERRKRWKAEDAAARARRGMT
ncbi:hypothetical protein AB0L13_16560 [Saccharopolyspora shandongensis]|uniref:hypothetical protein n=1 Tax=Saccharopolyspora shandongensis TaxID=418495 RepID=UPI00342F847C